MQRRTFLKRMAAVTSVAGLPLTSCSKTAKPNILFIMSDDHTSQAIGAYGKRFAKLNPTPTIDRLANEGMLFENVFCTNSICTPSRACIMTGQYPHTNGAVDLDCSLSPEKHYLSKEMKKSGYQTAIIGKWHLTFAPETFDYYCVLPGQGKYKNPILYTRDEGEERNIRFSSNVYRKVHVREFKGHSTDVITDLAINYLQNRREKDRPFFFMLHYKAPHDMFVNAERYDDYMKDVDFPEPESMWEQPKFGSEATRGKNDSLYDTIGSSIGKRNKIRNMGKHMKVDPNLPEKEYKREAYKRYMQRYFRCVKGVDDNLKRVFKYLKDNDLMDNTIIIYTGDQGFYLGEHDYIDKRWMYEESLRMPFLVRYPKFIKAGSKCNWMINNTDFAPTLLDLAGVPTPDYMQGRSFVGALKGNDEPNDWPKSTYYRYWMHMAHNHNNPAHFGIRTKKYKLIFYYGTDWTDGSNFEKFNGRKLKEEAVADGNRYWQNTPPAWEFYDLENDPNEMKNEYGNPKYQAIIGDLKNELKEKRIELGNIRKFKKL